MYILQSVIAWSNNDMVFHFLSFVPAVAVFAGVKIASAERASSVICFCSHVFRLPFIHKISAIHIVSQIQRKIKIQRTHAVFYLHHVSM